MDASHINDAGLYGSALVTQWCLVGLGMRPKMAFLLCASLCVILGLLHLLSLTAWLNF